MILDVIKDKENYQKHFHECKLIQRKRRIWEITQQYGELTLLHLSKYYKNSWDYGVIIRV